LMGKITALRTGKGRAKRVNVFLDGKFAFSLEAEVAVKEGLRLEQVAQVVADQTDITQDEFLALVTTGWRDAGFAFSFLADVPPTATLEGFLLPETYRLAEDAAAMDLLTRMLETFDARVTPEMRAAAANRGLNVYELVTLAAIVEREAVLSEERPDIAGVYHNRLRDGWFLGADPTVQYALSTPDNWWPPFMLEDTQVVDSPYNTYRNLGLPPGPICSPGLASIEASAYPSDSDYFFFLVDCTKNNGSHFFAITAEEHNSNYVLCGGE
ncbi:MAG: endolytic transglycosylase MltG, partial [Anaerolineae bacterium]